MVQGHFWTCICKIINLKTSQYILVILQSCQNSISPGFLFLLLITSAAEVTQMNKLYLPCSIMSSLDGSKHRFRDKNLGTRNVCERGSISFSNVTISLMHSLCSRQWTIYSSWISPAFIPGIYMCYFLCLNNFQPVCLGNSNIIFGCQYYSGQPRPTTPEVVSWPGVSSHNDPLFTPIMVESHHVVWLFLVIFKL